MTQIPPDDYVLAFERRDYQDALHNKELRYLWEEDKDRLAGAFLALARAYLEEHGGNRSGAIEGFTDCKALAEKEEGFKATSLAQHAVQCIEYLGMGKPLPELPSHF